MFVETMSTELHISPITDLI